MSDEIQKARKMTFRLYAIGERSGSPHAGEIAQMLAINAYSQNDKALNVIKLSLETAETNVSTAPLNKAVKLFMDARQDITRPFVSRSDCLQSCIYDVILCYTSFWGQVFEYYETMYYKPVELPEGGVDTQPATVSFEVGWQITCLFIRDIMLSAAARAAGVANGYNRSMSWFFYPANATSELEEAKSIVLTVIARIRKRGTLLVGNEGMLGHISFSNTVPLTHWVEDNLYNDWNNTERLAALSQEYFESTTIRVNVNVTPISSDSSADTMNLSFGPETSFLEGLENEEGESSPMRTSRMTSSMSSRSIGLNIRPVTPILLGSALCEWGGVEMAEFCREIVLKCNWPEVANTVSTAGQMGYSLINMSAEVAVSKLLQERRKSLSAPSRLSVTPDAVLPFSTPAGMPNLEPLLIPPGSGVAHFGIPIPELTPTPRPTPPVARRARDSEVTFFGGFDDEGDRLVSPLEPVQQALVALPSDADFDFSNDNNLSASSPSRKRAVLSRPSVVASPQQMPEIAARIVAAANRDLSSKDWSLERALGSLGREGKSMESLYKQIQGSDGRKRRRSSSSSSSNQNSTNRKDEFPVIDMQTLKEADRRITESINLLTKRSLKHLTQTQKNTLDTLSRILALASICIGDSSVSCLKSAVAVSADLLAFCHNIKPMLLQTDVFGAGLRGAYADANIAMIEAAKDVGLFDWYKLSLFFNDTAFQVLLSPDGLLEPNVVSSAPARMRAAPPQKLVQNHMSIFERLQPHCFLVCSELMMRWAWAPGSRLWIVHAKLTSDYLIRRHEFAGGEEVYETDKSEIEVFNYFVKQCLLNAGQYLCDLAERLELSEDIIHASFDIVRATILLRPDILKGRHMYHIVYCALVAASNIFSPPPVDFARVTQAAIVMQPNPDAQAIIRDYVCQSVSLSSNGAATQFSDGSAALVLPNASGRMQPEFQLTGDVKKFYETVFVGEMRQILFNIRKVTRPNDLPHLDLGPYPQNAVRHPSLSPFAFISLSSSLALALQQTLGEPGMQARTEHYQYFQKAMTIVSPLGLLPCLLPPIEPADVAINRGDKVFKWMNDAAIKSTRNGCFTVIKLAYQPA